METWKPIENYNGFYSVSNFGRAISHRHQWGKRKTPRIMKQHPDQKGYLMINLCKKGIHKTHRVAVLVAKHFIGERPLGLTINHKDFNKINNHVSNLEYVTNLENMRHAIKNNPNRKIRKGEEIHHLVKFNEKQIKRIRKLFKNYKYTYTSLGKKFNVWGSTIERIINRKTWKHI